MKIQEMFGEENPYTKASILKKYIWQLAGRYVDHKSVKIALIYGLRDIPEYKLREYGYLLEVEESVEGVPSLKFSKFLIEELFYKD